MIIGIVGSRRRDAQEDFDAVEQEFLKHHSQPDDIICSGLCPQGADRFAVILAKKYNTGTLWFPAEWSKYGRSAGFRRNTYIAAHSDILIACVVADRTGGTEDTIRKFLGLGKDQLFLV